MKENIKTNAKILHKPGKISQSFLQDGIQWSQMVSDGLGWSQMVSDGLGWSVSVDLDYHRMV